MRVLHLIVIVVLVVSAGCVTSPPIQEMSDARLAIAAAREANAEKLAPESLAKAAQMLRSAEQHLERRAYQSARRDAGLAKELATAAREEAESLAETPRRDTAVPIK